MSSGERLSIVMLAALASGSADTIDDRDSDLAPKSTPPTIGAVTNGRLEAFSRRLPV